MRGGGSIPNTFSRKNAEKRKSELREGRKKGREKKLREGNKKGEGERGRERERGTERERERERDDAGCRSRSPYNHYSQFRLKCIVTICDCPI